MEETEYDFLLQYQDYSDANHRLPLNKGDMLFILGANGTGKTGLLQNFTAQNSNKAQRILAHRQNWLNSDSIDLTPAMKIQQEKNMRKYDANFESRFKDSLGPARSQILLSNLLEAENRRNKNIAHALDMDDHAGLEESRKVVSPFKKLNELLETCNLLIEIYQNEHGSFYARKNGSDGFSIAQLSDGERNAILLISEVLTALEGRLFLIDEPERHLHRSIISPLINSLLLERPDCAFVVSTHEINLPLDCPEADILLVRGCSWSGNSQKWDADLIDSADDIDFQVKKDILGSQRTLLFVEGEEKSLDYHIYKLLFPDISVIPQKTCKEVEKAVKGISETQNLQWIKAYGLIDRDDRIDEQVQKLKEINIFALESYAVESLYYDPYVIKKLAEMKAHNEGHDSKALFTDAKEKITESINKKREDLCARLCERKIKDCIAPPTWKEIISGNCEYNTPDAKEIFETEKQRFDKLIENQDIEKIVTRYPIKNTGCCSEIARALKFQNNKDYENAVRQQILNDPELKDHIRDKIKNLAEKIEQEHPVKNSIKGH